MITPTLKPLAALAVAATLAACDGVPIPDYPLSKSGAPESTLEIVNASGQPLRSLSYEGCNSLAKQTVLIEPGVLRRTKTAGSSLRIQVNAS